MKEFERKDKFYDAVKKSMQLLDVDLVPYENIRLELCDKFRDGAYLHSKK